MSGVQTSSLGRIRWLLVAALLAAWVSAFTLPGMIRPSGLGLVLCSLAALSVVASNLFLAVFRRAAQPLGSKTVALILVGDALALTLLLASTGGAMNPFSALYFVQIALATTLLNGRFAVLVVATTSAAFASLFLGELPAGHGNMTHHLQGMWVAFVLTAMLIAVIVLRLHRELERERAKVARTGQVAALTTLAASAAHELGSPIGSIALAAEGLEELLSAGAIPERASSDVTLIREEVERCREVLRSLANTAGSTVGEGFKHTSMQALLENAKARLGQSAHRINVSGDLGRRVEVPEASVTTCLVNLLQNAIDVSPEEDAVELSGRISASDRIAFEVSDQGPGMSSHEQSMATEPFVSGKEQGTGLGLFLTKAVVEQLEGTLSFANNDGAEGGGMTVRVELPRTPRTTQLAQGALP